MNCGGLRMQKQLSGSDRNIGKQIILGIILIAVILVSFIPPLINWTGRMPILERRKGV